jgi:hypothetical protein
LPCRRWSDSASDAGAIALPLRRRRAPHTITVNPWIRIADNFLPEMRGELMMAGLWDWQTTGLRLKERIPDGNMAPSAAGVDSGANRPTGAAHAALMTKKRAQKPYDEKCP